MNKDIQTYRANNHWCVRVYGVALAGHFESKETAFKHGEWYLKTQRAT